MRLLRWLVPVAAVLVPIAASVHAGCEGRSDASRERIVIPWITDVAIAPTPSAKTQPTEGSGEAADALAEKPLMILVKDRDPKSKAMAKIEQLLLTNEQVAIGARFFETIKVSADDADKDRILSKAGKKTPRFVFLRRNYDVHTVLEGKLITAVRIVRTMKAIVSLEYETSFGTVLRGYRKLLDRLDLLDDRRIKLEDMRKRLEAKPDAKRLAKLESEEAALEADMAKWEEDEETLLDFKLREPHKT